jgi:hypothetical protein
VRRRNETIIGRARQLAKYLLARGPLTLDGLIEKQRESMQSMAADLWERRETPMFEATVVPLAGLAVMMTEDVECLLLLAANFIEQGKPLPKPLRELVVRSLRRPRPPLSVTISRRGRDARDRAIAYAVREIVRETGLKPTRNRTRRMKGAFPSACSIVADTLGNRKINLSEDAVEKIWGEYSKRRAKFRRNERPAP